VSASTVTTDAQGFAQVNARLGSTIGTQQFTASVTGAAGSPVTFTAAGLVGSATGLIIVDGDNQVGAISTGLAKPFTVKVIDSSGNGVAGVTVDFAAIAGGGSVFPASGVSNSDGIVFAAGTLGPQSGPQSGGLNPLHGNVHGDSDKRHPHASRDFAAQLDASGGRLGSLQRHRDLLRRLLAGRDRTGDVELRCSEPRDGE
jgi:hypothetical protein